ncbi:MAG TPA: thioredoxin-like domain-containing protein [Chitinophagaceae bacterium]|nr:thioredoxin-like domain-containing protein [Chitinophagaceae bacterium]
MKRAFFFLCFFSNLALFAQQGYEIKITFKPFKNRFIYLGHYYGKQYPIIDSALLNEKSEAVFKGSKNLPGGIYLVGYPDRAGFFEILIDKQQHFSLVADTATLKENIHFENSPDNVLFVNYQHYMGAKGKKIDAAKTKLSEARTKADSVKWTSELSSLEKTIREHRDSLIKSNPANILSALLITMREPIMPESLKNPSNLADSIAAYNFFKKHFWDGVSFGDGRLAYTTFFEEKLDKYFTQLVVPQPDSVIREIDYMLGFASINEEMTQFLLLKFVNRYLNQHYMWEDVVYVHLFEKYFAQRSYAWLNEKGRKTITDRAYNLMANIMGTAAAEIVLPDSSGNKTSLYAQASAFTVVCFWDPTCGHCKEVLPKLDSFYQAKWKKLGLKIFAVAKETDGSKKDWLEFINSHQLTEWTHVYYSRAEDRSRIDAGTPGYSQLYDVMTFPTLYLLDKEKRIIAKKLTYQQIDDVLEVKLKGQ